MGGSLSTRAAKGRIKPDTRKHCLVRRAFLAAPAVALCSASFAQGPEDPSDDPQMESAELSDLLDVARDELRAAGLPAREVQLRLKIIEDVATLKAYFPHVGGRPEKRNSKYWTHNEEGDYVPRGKPTE